MTTAYMASRSRLRAMASVSWISAALAGLLVGEQLHHERAQQVAAHDVEVGGGRLGSCLRYCPWAAYLASVASLAGRHQASLSRYQAMVSARPAAKSVRAGSQPSSRRSLVASIA